MTELVTNTCDNIILFLKENPNNLLDGYINKNELYECLSNEQNHPSHKLDEIYEIIFNSCNLDNLKYILESGINIHFSNFNDYGSIFQIALSCALSEKPNVTFEILKKQLNMLISHGFDINNYTINEGSIDEHGKYDALYPNLLFYITSYQGFIQNNMCIYKNIIEYLISLGINQNLQNCNGDTILHMMAFTINKYFNVELYYKYHNENFINNPKLLHELLCNYVDITIKNNAGLTQYDLLTLPTVLHVEIVPQNSSIPLDISVPLAIAYKV